MVSALPDAGWGQPRPDPESGPAVDSPAATALGQVIAVFPAAIRVTCGLAGACVALAVRTPPVDVPLLAVVVGVLTGWSLLFTRWTLRRGLTTAVVAVDLTLTVITCLLMRHLVAAEVLPGEVSWVAILASTSIVVAQLGLPASRSIPAGLLIVGAYAFGAHLAGDDAEAMAHATTLTVQTFCGAGLAYLARRGSRLADAAFADYQRVSRQALVARAARAAERRHNRDLHDTVLSTLTVIGLGAVPARSPQLRERAIADLRTLAELAEARAQAGSGGPAGGLEPLDRRLRAALDRLPHQRLTADLDQCAVPPAVAEAITSSLTAALSNVERHAPDAEATVRLRRTDGTVVVEVTDDGPGFDPATVPAHRYGLRESIHGRMATIGGRADVDSAPGHGTRVRLEWPVDR